jgi:hypothetical protein
VIARGAVHLVSTLDQQARKQRPILSTDAENERSFFSGCHLSAFEALKRGLEIPTWMVRHVKAFSL